MSEPNNGIQKITPVVSESQVYESIRVTLLLHGLMRLMLSISQW